jgi:predicted DNA-binding transcriptional regulator YafY
MPSTRPATLTREDLPDTLTAQELADYERVDVRTIRHDLAAGNVPGAWRRGKAWRISRDAYLEAIGRTDVR